MLFRQVFAGNQLKVLVSSIFVVSGRQYVMGIHAGNKARGAQLGKLLSRQWIRFQKLYPFAENFLCFLRLLYFRSFAALGHYGFEIHKAHDRTHSGPSCRAFVAEYPRIFYQVFSGRTYDYFSSILSQGFLCLIGGLAP
ncbi:hypothetical protein SDC9_158914 [bioreactor metagenome]|uniref:Uncharacterized protein n=1 Tax=bioreactor metagenome TaxID=1076179 RepID=A0A645FBC8_9ZZZZ